MHNTIGPTLRVLLRTFITAALATAALSMLIYLVLYATIQYFGFGIVADFINIIPNSEQPLSVWMCEDPTLLIQILDLRMFSTTPQAIYYLSVIASPYILVFIFALLLGVLRKFYMPSLKVFSVPVALFILVLLILGGGLFVTASDWYDAVSNNELAKAMDRKPFKYLYSGRLIPNCPEGATFLTLENARQITIMGFSALLGFGAIPVLAVMSFGRYFPKPSVSDKQPSIGFIGGVFALIMIGLVGYLLNQQLSLIEVEQDIFVNLRSLSETAAINAGFEGQDVSFDWPLFKSRHASQFLQAWYPLMQMENYPWRIFAILMISAKGFVILSVLVLLASLGFHRRLEAIKLKGRSAAKGITPPTTKTVRR